ncbi:DMT family transporter [Chitinophaga barathri]|uniref:DMT family transporter n=1 Tax=Chitinophaga barathri TaxID=1647451 RepID=A0A3N4MVE5_9BACT|nr:DMT family transporter [Chitinophaga barathri]RPD39363.1 DMT family transporter [Chitinophaga barathri]
MPTTGAPKGKLILAGITFAFLWASASAATKVGLSAVQPLTLFVPRFFIASAIMLLISHAGMKKRLPRGKEWIQVAVYGLFNISLYLGIYVVGMQETSAGLGALATATNPVFISLLSAIWLRKPLRPLTILSLTLCLGGIAVAAWPLIAGSYATPLGLGLVLLSMVAYSIGSIYFSASNFSDLHIFTINGWQTFFGGLFLLPVMIGWYDPSLNDFNLTWLLATLWLIGPVSMLAVLLWLFLLKDNPVKASFWLFLCPVFGFAISAVLMHEPLSLFTLAGVALVVLGLFLVQRWGK